jgi:acyl-coenzyme A thioesterase PaaI-like protein
MAFADFTMYYGARTVVDNLLNPTRDPSNPHLSAESLAMVTISMTCDFMGAVKLGDFLESRCEVGRGSKGITFMRNRLLVGDKCVMQCSGTYTLKNANSKI